MHPTYYRGCWHVVSRCLFFRYRQRNAVLSHPFSSLTKAVYNPKTFILHAAWLDQGCPHCPKFPTAASRRSLGRVSVPVWPSTLSGRLRIVALVSRYLTSWLMRHKPIPVLSRGIFNIVDMRPLCLCGLSCRFQQLSPSQGQVAYVLLTRSPLNAEALRPTCMY